MKLIKAAAMLVLALCLPAAGALAEYDAQSAGAWLEQFAQEIAQLQPKNDVASTADPARSGEYLLQYAFGTVAAKTQSSPGAQDILRVELTQGDVTDCMGVSVGQTLEDVIGGRQIEKSDTPLYVLSTQEAGLGWSWAYVGEQGVYGVEFITYGDGMPMKEYTLTYVIADGCVSAIRMQIADATPAQAQEGLRTVEEIAGRQMGEVLITPNDRAEFASADMAIGGRTVIAQPVETLVAAIGEPQEVQALPGGYGRMLVYDQSVAQIVFDEMTGVEYVRSISCASPAVEGPRGLRVGMTLQEAAALFRCDASVYSVAGTLYLAGEAQGIPPCGELIRDDASGYTLRYACLMADGTRGVLDIVISDGAASHWRLYQSGPEGEYDGE